MKKFLKYGLGGFVALLLLATAGYLAWSEFNIATPAAEAMAAMQPGDGVSIEEGTYIVFRPTGVQPTTGLILYPGANCDPRGYAPVLRRIARRGYLVVDVPMPLNQAIFAPGRADDVIAAFPGIRHWVLAGHSMGGAMASTYAARHPDSLAGLILWDGASPASSSMVDVQYPVWHIHRATLDGQPPEKFAEARKLFPVSSTWIPVPGGIHMQFGSFDGGGYKEDWKPLITRQQQQDMVVTATLNALQAMSPPDVTPR